MEFWIKENILYAWTDSRRIQERVIARDVIDADYDGRSDQWLVVKTDGAVQSLNGYLQTVERTYSRCGLRARWVNEGVQIQEEDGRSRIYDIRGFLQRTF